MWNRSETILITVVGMALTGALGLGVLVHGEETVQNVHRLAGHGGHHGDADGDPMAAMAEQLGLDANQRQHVEKVGALLHGPQARSLDPMQRLHEELIAGFRSGDMDAGSIKGSVDSNLEQIRELAYSITEEMVALADSLDPEQREMLLEHLGSFDRHAGEPRGY